MIHADRDLQQRGVRVDLGHPLVAVQGGLLFGHGPVSCAQGLVHPHFRSGAGDRFGLLRSVRAVPNRPDSRHRLAALQVAAVPVIGRADVVADALRGADFGPAADAVPQARGSETNPVPHPSGAGADGDGRRFARARDGALGSAASRHAAPAAEVIGGWVPDAGPTNTPGRGQPRQVDRLDWDVDRGAEGPGDLSGAGPDDGPGGAEINDWDGDFGPGGGVGSDDERRPRWRASGSALTRSSGWRRLARRWVPTSLHDSRIDPGRRGALLLTLVAAVAALAAAIGVWRDRPEPAPVQSVALAAVSDAPSIGAGGLLTPRSTAPGGGSSSPGLSALATGTRASSAASSGPTGVIVVSVTGAVRKPGLVRLVAGSRVADAIAQAGGSSPAADLTGLNLAQKLFDGASVVVGTTPATTLPADPSGGGSSVTDDGDGAASASTAQVGRLNLNTADVAALDALPGVGPVTAAGIVAWRQKNGHFSRVEQLQEIPGIGPAKYAALAPLVTV